MGNSESQYSLQGSRSSSFTLPNIQKPYSFCSPKEEILTSHSWWRSGSRVPGLKTKSLTHGCFSHLKTAETQHRDHVTTAGDVTRTSGEQWNTPGLKEPEIGNGSSENTYENVFRTDGCNGHAANGYKTPDKKSRMEELEDQRSPRVVIKSDGSVRVEFNQLSKNSLLPGECGGPVQLLKFSPTVPSSPTPATSTPTAANPATRSSKGSSLSSEGSWYDSPWGGAGEPHADGTSPDRLSGTLPSALLDYSGPQPSDLYRHPSMAATFPVAKELKLADGVPFHHRSSFVCVMEEPDVEDFQSVQQYSSFTLPARKPHPAPENSGRKESVRNRMRQLSDWTGSLSRRRKKVKEPRYKEPADCFDSGVDGLTADTSSPSQVSSLRGQSRTRSHSQLLPSCGGSVSALHPNTDALRQNIYHNFMRELETSHAAGGSVERGENSAEETESSSEETLASLEQLDLLFEKEQGVVRRAGWLTFKPLLKLHKDRKLELVARRKWKQYWVTLKGCTLQFYDTYGKGCPDQDASPSFALLAEDGVVQAVPEHPKKESVFCLSNAYGDVYLFQASSQTDLENWVTAIHSASASLLAKRQGKEDTLLLLRGQIRSLLQKIDMDGKMKKMAELQLSIVTDSKNRKAIENQIQQWDQNLERFNIDLFRMRCYLASLQGGELPNPKSLLATASRSSKAALGRLGMFSVSSFHALICSRDEATLRKRSLSLSQRSRGRKGVFSSLKGLDSLTKRSRDKRPSASQDCLAMSYYSHSSVCQIFDGIDGEPARYPPPCSRERLDGSADGFAAAPEGSCWNRSLGTPAVVYMPDYQAVTVHLQEQHTVTDVLQAACEVRNLDPSAHCLRVHRCLDDRIEVSTPAAHELLRDLSYDELEVSSLTVCTLHMTRPSHTGDFGFAVSGRVDTRSRSRIFVTEVLADGLAFREGLRPGDEILVLNGCEVSTLDLALIQTLFGEQTLRLTISREPASRRASAVLLQDGGSQQILHDCLYRPLRAKSDTDVSCLAETSGDAALEHHLQQTLNHRAVQLSKSVETMCSLYHAFQEGSGGLMENNKASAAPDSSLLRPCPRHMSVSERLRKVIQELVDTEKSYVKDLSCLFELYLKPLQKETFLSQDEMESLFGSLPEMLDFQKVFLQTLEKGISSSPDFDTLETPVQFKKLLFSLGGSFLYYADHFKLYSGFCANHIKVQKVLERAKTDQAFKQFLDARNPNKQHSSTLESYLIKPVQRVLKYPLLLRELVSLTDTDSEEHHHLTEALKAMEKVASHINEMQKIYEDYGAVFDHLVAEQCGPHKEVTEISMGEFLVHSSVMWLNPFPSLGRMKKEPELTVFVFKKAVILVCKENKQLKKKTNVPRSGHGDQDLFKFRWLVPLSALQVRLGNMAETNCIWELIHTKSEVEGRPESVFQLCSSSPENKLNMVKVIRSILRENMRKGMLRPAERTCKGRHTPWRKTLPASAKLGSSRASWLCNKPIDVNSLSSGDLHKPPDSDSASESSAEPTPVPRAQTPPATSPARLKESDILGDEDDGFSEHLARRDSTPGAIETQFQDLRLTEETRLEPEGREVDPPEGPCQLRRAHFCPIKRRSAKGDPRRSQGALLSLRRQSRSLDSQSESTMCGLDLNALLEREFSVQSLTSVVNEDCFFDNAPTPGPATTS